MAAEHITNADIVAVFTEAKKSLVGMAYGGFVCNIIEDQNLPGAPYAVELIAQRIAPCRTATNWLVHNGHTTWDILNEDFSSLSREYRQLWLDSLIMEFSSYDPAGNPPPLKS